MEAGIYKKGQGYWTRVMSAIAWGLLVLMGAQWLWDVLKLLRLESVEPVYVSAIGATLFLAIFGGIGFWLVGRKKKIVDFMIATEGEMKKVNWSSKREIIGSTWVVIALTVLVACLIFVFDYMLFAPFFRWIGVLET